MLHVKGVIVLSLLLHFAPVCPLGLRIKKSLDNSFPHISEASSQRVEPTPAPSQGSANVDILSVVREGLSGAFAGAVQVLLLMWLRTTMSHQHKYGHSLQHTMTDLYRHGGIRRFYKGVEFAIIQAPLSKFFSVAANDCTLLMSRKWKDQSSLQIVIFTAIGGAISSLFRALLMPIDTCKTVLQVDGSAGFQRLTEKVLAGHLSVLYQGTLATIITTFVGHYPWYTVHNYLQIAIATPPTAQQKILKTALIAFVATAVADVFSNCFRVVKTVKQTSNHLTYSGTIANILSNDGYKGLFGRGMLIRLIGNGIQSMMFTIIWKLTSIRQQ